MTAHQIKTIRLALKLNQQTFAQRLGVRAEAISRYESGTRSPTDEVCKRLEALNAFIESLKKPHILEARVYEDKRGTLRVWGDLPFPAVRKFTISDVPFGESRGNHSHATCDQIITAMEGEFALWVTNSSGHIERIRVYQGKSVFVPRKHWIHLRKFSARAVALVLCSEQYAPERDCTDFNKFMRG